MCEDGLRQRLGLGTCACSRLLRLVLFASFSWPFRVAYHGSLTLTPLSPLSTPLPRPLSLSSTLPLPPRSLPLPPAHPPSLLFPPRAGGLAWYVATGETRGQIRDAAVTPVAKVQLRIHAPGICTALRRCRPSLTRATGSSSDVDITVGSCVARWRQQRGVSRQTDWVVDVQ